MFHQRHVLFFGFPFRAVISYVRRCTHAFRTYTAGPRGVGCFNGSSSTFRPPFIWVTPRFTPRELHWYIIARSSGDKRTYLRFQPGPLTVFDTLASCYGNYAGLALYVSQQIRSRLASSIPCLAGEVLVHTAADNLGTNLCFCQSCLLRSSWWDRETSRCHAL